MITEQLGGQRGGQEFFHGGQIESTTRQSLIGGLQGIVVRLSIVRYLFGDGMVLSPGSR